MRPEMGYFLTAVFFFAAGMWAKALATQNEKRHFQAMQKQRRDSNVDKPETGECQEPSAEGLVSGANGDGRKGPEL